MLDLLIKLAIARRNLVMVVVAIVALLGLWNFNRLPIDAVPDITNVQVMINTEAPGFTPLEVEQRITYPLETALAGLPGLEYTRSVSRYGLSQVIAIFSDDTDIYFARQLVGERMASASGRLPYGLQPEMGPIATGLGEIFMFTVDAEPGAMNAGWLAAQILAISNPELEQRLQQARQSNAEGVRDKNRALQIKLGRDQC